MNESYVLDIITTTYALDLEMGIVMQENACSIIRLTRRAHTVPFGRRSDLRT